MVANLLAPHLERGRSISPAELLGEQPEVTSGPLPGIFESPEDLHAALLAQRERLRAEAEAAEFEVDDDLDEG